MRWLLVLAVIAILMALYCKRTEPTTQTATPTSTTSAVSEPEETSDRSGAGSQANSQAAAQDKLKRIQDIARRNNVQIAQYTPTGNGAIIKIQWSGSSAGPGGDFMNQLISEGVIRNVNLPAANEQGYYRDQQMRPVYWVQYTVIF